MAAISAILLAIFAIPMVRATPGTAYSFDLKGPNVTMAAATVSGTHIKEGDWFRIEGSGTFDTLTSVVSGGGVFTHFNFDGTIHNKAIWMVAGFVSFDSYGGPHPRKQGGLLKIIVDVYPYLHPEPKATIMFIISCLVNAPGGAPAEGVTVWTSNGVVPLFDIVVRGHTGFRLSE